MDTPPDRRARRKLDQAAASGLFERTSGRGKPLALTPDDPNVPADLRLAFRVMRDANVSPPWIALAGEVEQALDDLRGHLSRHTRRMRELRESLVSGRAADFKDAFKSARETHLRQRREFQRLLDETRTENRQAGGHGAGRRATRDVPSRRLPGTLRCRLALA